MIYSLCDAFLENRFSRRSWDLVFVLTVSGLLFGINQLHNSRLNFAFSLCVALSVGLVLFTGAVRERAYRCLLGCLVIFTTEFLGFLFLSGQGLHQNELSRIAATILTKLAAFTILQIICRNAKSRHFRPGAGSGTIQYFFFYPVSCFVLLTGLRYSNIQPTPSGAGDRLLLLGLILLLFSNMLLFFLYDHILTISEQLRNHELNQERERLNQRHFAIIQETNQQYAALLHDVNNYIQTIQTLQKQQENTHIQAITQSIMTELSDINRHLPCESPILNAILDEKKQFAKQHQIDLQTFIEAGFRIPDIEDKDLISILCNLLDNAIEAVSSDPHVSETDRCVSIECFINHGFCIIRIQNPCHSAPLPGKKGFRTSKSDPTRHGLGLHRVESIAERYGGSLNCKVEDHVFATVVALPCRDEEG